MKSGVGAPLSWNGRQFMFQGGSYVKGNRLRLRLEEEVEWVEHRHLGHQVHFDQELAGRLSGRPGGRGSWTADPAAS